MRRVLDPLMPNLPAIPSFTSTPQHRVQLSRRLFAVAELSTARLSTGLRPDQWSNCRSTMLGSQRAPALGLAPV